MSQTLAVSLYRPKQDPIACVEIVHGMAEHRKRYEEFARYLQKKGFAVVTYDLPGHGETAQGKMLGWFGAKNGWQTLVNSALEVARVCRKEFQGKKLFLMGHSMGSMIARCVIQENDDLFDGVILSGAPAYNKASSAGIPFAKAIRAIKGPKALSKTLDNMVTGNLNKSVQNPKTESDWLSVNEENVQKYIDDPLCGFGFTVQGYIDELEGMKRMADPARYKAKHWIIPIYLFSGEEDPCVGGPEGWKSTIDLLKNAGYKNVTDRRYPGMRHETLNETGREQVYADVLEWLKMQTNR